MSKCEKCKELEAERDQMAAVLAGTFDLLQRWRGGDGYGESEAETTRFYSDMKKSLSSVPAVVLREKVEVGEFWADEAELSVSLPSEYIGKDVLVTVQEVE